MKMRYIRLHEEVIVMYCARCGRFIGRDHPAALSALRAVHRQSHCPGRWRGVLQSVPSEDGGLE